ncbi:MAG: hypothetical protein AAGD07_20155 [Planctomycetota bacterium]
MPRGKKKRSRRVTDPVPERETDETQRPKRGGKKRRKRNAGSRSSHRLVTMGLGALLATALSAACLWIAFQQIEGQRLATLATRWNRADEAFDRGQYAEAEKLYGEIVDTREVDRTATDDLSMGLASLMQDLCRGIQAVRLSDIVSLREKLTASEELLFPGIEDQPISNQRRIEEISKWVASSTEQLLKQSQGLLPDLPSSLEQAINFPVDHRSIDTTLTQVGNWQTYFPNLVESSEEMHRLASELSRRRRLLEHWEVWLPSCTKALKTLERPALQELQEQYEAVADQQIADDSKYVWRDFQRRLLAKLRSGTPVLDDRDVVITSPELGESLDVVPRNHIAAASRTGVRDLARATTNVGRRLVFARVHHHVYALDSTNGDIQWVLPAGLSTKLQPKMLGQEAVLWPWKDVAGQSFLSLVSAHDGSPIWTIGIGGDADLTSYAVSSSNRIFLGVSDGRVWEVTDDSGERVRSLVLPERLRGPVHFDNGGRTAVAVGKSGTIWRIDLSGKPRVAGASFRELDPSFTASHAAWIEPFLLVIDNRLDRKCVVQVYRAMPANEVRDPSRTLSSGNPGEPVDDYALLQSIDLEGRVWGEPKTLGSTICFSTDAIEHSLWSVDVGSFSEPLTPHAHWSTPVPFPIRPEVTVGGSDLLIHVGQGQLSCRQPNSLRDRKDAFPKQRWMTPLESEDAVPTQPLQIWDKRVLVVAQDPDHGHVRASCHQTDNGKTLWSRSLGGEIVEVVHKSRSTLLRDSAGTLYTGPKEEAKSMGSANSFRGEMAVRALNVPPVRQYYDWLADPPVLLRSENTRLLATSWDNQRLAEVALGDSLAAPPAARVCKLGVSDVSAKPNLWVAVIDDRQRFRVVGMNRHLLSAQPIELPLVDEALPANVSQADRLPRQDGSAMGRWYRPLWLDDSHIVAANRDGRIRLAKTLHEGMITYLRRVDRRVQALESPMSEPVLFDGQLWVCAAERLIALDLNDLSEIWHYPLHAEVSADLRALTSTSAETQILAVGMRDGRVIWVKPRHEVIEARVSNRPIKGIFGVEAGVSRVLDALGAMWDITDDGLHQRRRFGLLPPETQPLRLGQDWYYAYVDGRVTPAGPIWSTPVDLAQMRTPTRASHEP